MIDLQTRPLASATMWPRKPARATDRVFDALIAAIRDVRLAPGSEISESELAGQFNVSRTPIREALARLADVGLVTVVPQVGTRVALISMTSVREAQFIREHLEVAAFTAACSRGTTEVGTLRALIADQRAAAETGDLDRFFTADEALHASVFSCGGQAGVWQVVQRSKLHLDRLRRLTLPDGDVLASLIADHEAIVECLNDGAVEDGCTHIRRHAQLVLACAPELQREHPDYFN